MRPRLPPRFAPRADGGYRRQINRAPSPLIANIVPWLSIILASMASFSPIVASAPVLPPVSFLLLLAWRVLRPGLLPVWAGLPLGMIDDLYSGQPFGSAILLWSLTMVAMDLIDTRFLWRGFLEDWLAAAALIAGYVLLAAVIAGLAARHQAVFAVAPQMVLAMVLYPVAAGLVALLDRLRLLPLRLGAV